MDPNSLDNGLMDSPSHIELKNQLHRIHDSFVDSIMTLSDLIPPPDIPPHALVDNHRPKIDVIIGLVQQMPKVFVADRVSYTNKEHRWRTWSTEVGLQDSVHQLEEVTKSLLKLAVRSRICRSASSACS